MDKNIKAVDFLIMILKATLKPVASAFLILTIIPLHALCNRPGAGEDTLNISTGGFYVVEGAGREVFNFNAGWRFYKGSVAGAEKISYDDESWTVVNLPHGLELLPDEASGSVNYQGESWYRKKFSVPSTLKGKKIFLNFEAIMGKSRVWVNGQPAGMHFGGYLPLMLDITDLIRFDKENIIAVLADNSDDESYPPGKSQKVLDFSYFGGIYRDVWLISMDKLHITDPNYVNERAGGGVFVHYENLSKEKVTVAISTEVQNESAVEKRCTIETFIKDHTGHIIGQKSSAIRILPGSKMEIKQEIEIIRPYLWSPQQPYLYDLFSTIKQGKDKITDGFKTRIGARKIEFLGKKGFYLNNEPYSGKLMGVNRHQDFGYVGNALSNAIHWRDAKKLKEAGVNVIRTAHYPQDPAFMDACDALGIFYIEATPGWQFWNNDSIFVNRAYQDIRNMIRRNRNRPCVLLWEPVLNEAKYPDEFAKRANEIVREEFPFQGCYTACDGNRESSKYFDVLYSHPYAFKDMHTKYLKNNTENQSKYAIDYSTTDKCYFTREWGDCADDFNAQNSPSRAHRSWGEAPQLIQAMHYANPDYLYSSYNNIYLTPQQHVGGCLWHSFDHQRGYSPDTFYGGIMDIFRQPKYSCFMFASQIKPGTLIAGKKTEPMAYIVNEMTPFSPADIVVFSNCDSIRLTVSGKYINTITTKNNNRGMPYFPAVFKDAYRFYDVKALFRAGEKDSAMILAEGYLNGKVAVRTVKKPAQRPAKLKLEIDDSGIPMMADGSDFAVVIASITDNDGNVKRLNNKEVYFEVTGAGELVGDASIGANPRRIEWGTAPAIIKAGLTPGTIIVRAHLDERYFHTALDASLEIKTVSPVYKLLYDKAEVAGITANTDSAPEQYKDNQPESVSKLKQQLKETRNELNQLKLKEVERQQRAMEEGNEKGKQ